MLPPRQLPEVYVCARRPGTAISPLRRIAVLIVKVKAWPRPVCAWPRPVCAWPRPVCAVVPEFLNEGGGAHKVIAGKVLIGYSKASDG
jgi:hypothetical protein